MSERTELLDELRRMFKAFAEATPADFAREDLGPLGFQHATSQFEAFIGFINNVVAQVSPELMPDKKLRNFRGLVFQAHTLFVEIKNFTPDAAAANPFARRDTLIQQVADLYEDHFQNLAPYIAAASQPLASLAAVKKKADLVTSGLVTLEKDKREELDRILAETRELARKVKETAQETGVAKHSAIFADAAAEHARAAKRWLVALVALVILTAAAAGVSIWSTYHFRDTLAKFTGTLTAQLAVAKIIGFSLLFSAIVWSGRNYRAHRHNYIVNRHRQNALSSFETFVKSTSDQQTKNAVLLQATNSIFSPQPTGYVGDDAESSGSPQVVEIVRNLVEPGK